MKKILQIVSVFMFAVFYGQNISDYQYVTLQYTKFKTNKFGLESLLANELKKKNYTVIPENKEEWKTELQQNPCNVLIAELQNTSSMFRNKVTLNFKDCNDKTLASSEGKSFIKEFEPGMQDALKDALKEIKTSNPTEKKLVMQNNSQTIISEKAEIIVQNTSVAEPAKTTFDTTKKEVETTFKTEKDNPSKAEIYSNGSLTLNKIFLANGEFILVNPNNSVPFATFKPSAKKDVFRVQLQDGTTTLGYLEDGKIMVEIPNSDGSFRNEIFLKK